MRNLNISYLYINNISQKEKCQPILLKKDNKKSREGSAFKVGIKKI